MSSETASFYFGSFNVVAYLQFLFTIFLFNFLGSFLANNLGLLQPLKNLEGLTSFPSRKKNDIT